MYTFNIINCKILAKFIVKVFTTFLTVDLQIFDDSWRVEVKHLRKQNFRTFKKISVSFYQFAPVTMMLEIFLYTKYFYRTKRRITNFHIFIYRWQVRNFLKCRKFTLQICIYKVYRSTSWRKWKPSSIRFETCMSVNMPSWGLKIVRLQRILDFTSAYEPISWIGSFSSRKRTFSFSHTNRGLGKKDAI